MAGLRSTYEWSAQLGQDTLTATAVTAHVPGDSLLLAVTDGKTGKTRKTGTTIESGISAFRYISRTGPHRRCFGGNRCNRSIRDAEPCPDS